MDYLGYYRTLNLDPSRRYDINKKEIKEAFRKAVKRWHPDKHAMSANRSNARKKFDEAAIAYEVLKDSKLKKDYDEGILPSKR